MTSIPGETETQATPILDRLAPMPPASKPAGFGWRGWVLWCLSVFVVTWVSLLWNPPVLGAFWSWLLWVLAPLFAFPSTVLGLLGYGLAFVAGNLAAVLVHELGHALVGVAVGFRFLSLRISRIEIHKGFRVVRYRGTGGGSGGWFGGWANLLPDRTDRLSLRALAMLAAGPAANLLSAFVILQLPFSNGLFGRFFVLFSLILGLVNLVPFRSQAVHSDGARIWMLLRNRGRGERWLAMMRLLPEIVAGAPPDTWPAGFVAKAIAVRDDSPDTVTAHSIAYSVAFGGHQNDEGARCLEVCLRYSSFAAPPIREALMCDAAIFQARRRRRIDLAEQWRAALPAKTELPGLHQRAEAAILEAGGDVEGALNKLYECGRLVGAHPNPAQREAFFHSLNRWLSELIPLSAAKPSAQRPVAGAERPVSAAERLAPSPP